MSNNSFFSLPREKLIELYPVIINNSDEQYQTALDINAKNKPGIAIPHLLISSEELIKALVILLDAKGFKFRTIKGMDIFFRNHEIRFFISSLIFILSLFGDDLFSMLDSMKKDPTKATTLLTNFKNNDMVSMNKLKWYYLRKLVLIEAEMKWFSKAELFRQNGFYVDMKGNLLSPLSITAEEFNETKIRIDRVNKSIKYIIDGLESEEDMIKEEIEQLKVTFETNNYYELISKELENMRKGRKSFFDVFTSSVFDHITDRNERKKMQSFKELIAKKTNKITPNSNDLIN